MNSNQNRKLSGDCRDAPPDTAINTGGSSSSIAQAEDISTEYALGPRLIQALQNIIALVVGLQGIGNGGLVQTQLHLKEWGCVRRRSWAMGGCTLGEGGLGATATRKCDNGPIAVLLRLEKSNVWGEKGKRLIKQCLPGARGTSSLCIENEPCFEVSS